MQKTTFAIIGCGRAAAIHAKQILRYGKLLAVCDTDVEKGQAFAALHKARFYHDHRRMLQEETTVNVVVICTPNGLHAKQAIDAMKLQFHVLVEKPMALTVRDANKMIAVAKQTQQQLFTVMQNRFNPPVAALKKALDQKKLGQIYSVQLNCFWNRNEPYYQDSWHGTRALDGGTLFTQFSHFTDLLIWFFGPVKKVRSILSNAAHRQQMAFEDQGVVLLQWKSGTIGTMHYSVNAYEKNREGSITVLGEKGIVKIGGAYLNTIDYASIRNYTLQVKPAVVAENDYGTYSGSMRNHHQVYRSLINTLKKGKPYYTSAEEAKETIALINQIMKPNNENGQ